MNRFSLRTTKALILCAFVAVTSSRATTITFDSIAGSGNTPQTSLTTQGFTFTSDFSFYTIRSPGSVNLGGAISDGSVFISDVAGGLGQPIVMAANDGAAFSLSSLYGSKLFVNSTTAANGGFPNAASLGITGYLTGGGTVSATFGLNGSFQQFFLPSTFTGLSSVVFFGVLDSGLPGGAFSVDTITMQSTSVPDGGSTFALLAVTLIGLGLAWKKLNRPKPVLAPVRKRR